MTTQRPRFLFATCQIGAEPALKSELARRWPDFRFAYSRPGFLTFKLPDQPQLAADFDLGAIFARAYGFSLGKASGNCVDELAEQVWQVFSGQEGTLPFLWPKATGTGTAPRLHVWQRDTAPCGEHGFQPSVTPAAMEAEVAIRRHCPRPEMLAGDVPDHGRPGTDQRFVRRGGFVLDCVLVEPNQWWVGYHRAGSVPSLWPGGIPELQLPAGAVSRAWLKMEEALRWSQLPIPAGARCAEIGSAPGGASQALLSRGLKVIGIDPAAMEPAVLADPNFRQIRRRAIAVRRREFRTVRWLTADMNVAPNYTLDVVEQIVTHHEVNIRGMLITLKLIEWSLAEHLPEYLERVRSWGFNLVRARQLAYNRQEVCVCALKRPFVRKQCYTPSRDRGPQSSRR